MAKLASAAKKPMENIRKYIKSDVAVKTVIFIGLFAALLMTFLLSTSPQRYNLREGDIATEDIYAPSDMVDKLATERAMKAAEEAVQGVYKRDLTVQIDIEKKIDDLFVLVSAAKYNTELSQEQKLQSLEEQSGIDLDQVDYDILLSAGDIALKQLKDDTKYIIGQVMSDNVTEEQLDPKRDAIREFFASLPKSSKLHEIGTKIAVTALRPNLFYDEQTTLSKQQDARNNVEEVVIKKDTKIVAKGQEVTYHQLEILRAYGLLNGRGNASFNLRINIGFALITAIAMYVLGVYTSRFDKRLWSRSGELLLISILMVITLMLSAVLKTISQYLIILPACTMLIAILINPKIAVLCNTMMAVFISFVTEFNVTVIAAMLITGIFAAMMVHKTNHRSTIVFAGLGVSLLSIFTILSFGLISHWNAKDILVDTLYGAVGGILSSILTIGMLPFLESAFDIITPIKLLELSNPNQPILRKLLIEAPGTYYHSILVGNLAEAAAEDVGANSLLCRIGAYYHDVGKLKRPYFFKENQITRDNPHDKITPNLSALIITSHVKDGVELARKYKLPSSVVDIIREHHGNTLVSYFYHKAMNAEGGEAVSEDKFRYAFNRPQSKEAAIVMLADSVEAYIRSLTEPTQDQVEQGVRKIIRDKLHDSQLDQCDLTLKDLELIACAFVKVLAGIFHERIEYPENIKDI